MIYPHLFRPWLFRRDAEAAHEAMLARLARWRRGGPFVEALLTVDDARLQVRLLGHDLRNPIGVAAGLDKNGVALQAWRYLGFGFVEIGTVTPRPQPGNPQPRLFRLPADEALINRLGFNGAGAATVRANLQAARDVGLPIGVNVGKNKDTPLEEAVADYVAAIEALRDVAGWFVVNVSSPNTPELRRLQAPAAVRALVAAAVQAARRADGVPVPVLLKVAPDFETGELEATVDAALEGGAAGFVASNTTVARPALRERALAAETGGLSGRPLRSLATATVRRVYARTRGRVPIVGVGGVASADDAWEKILAGADVVQVYTGLVYEGPTLPWRINAGLLEILEREGVRELREVVGRGTA